MKHILFLSKDTSVCETPELLGKEFVFVDNKASGLACVTCGDLLTSYNEKCSENEAESVAVHNTKHWFRRFKS